MDDDAAMIVHDVCVRMLKRFVADLEEEDRAKTDEEEPAVE